MNILIDLTGQTFFYWKVIKKVENERQNGKVLWECECKCGTKRNITTGNLNSLVSKSCGCYQKEVNLKRIASLNLIGQKFDRLLVIELTNKKGRRRQRHWKCLCDCGNETIVTTTCLIRKKWRIRSCGCLQREMAVKTGLSKFMGHGVSAFNILVSSYKKGAKKRNLIYNLSDEQFKSIVKQNCHYCGIEPKQIYEGHRKGAGFIYNGIDRLNNDQGYFMENCVPCCKICNHAKTNLTEEEFQEWLNNLVNHQNKKRGLNEVG
jgi:hypothetical protein